MENVKPIIAPSTQGGFSLDPAASLASQPFERMVVAGGRGKQILVEEVLTDPPELNDQAAIQPSRHTAPSRSLE